MPTWNDARLALRTWSQTPALAVIVILTLALGIGATTTAFSIAYSVLVRPLPFPEPEELFWITSSDTRKGDSSEFIYNSNRMSQFLDWQQHLTSFAQLAAWGGTASPEVFTVTGAGTPERVSGLELTDQMLTMLGARPAMGRLLIAGDDAVGAARVAVISSGYWQRRFGGRSDLIGQPITIDNVSHTIVGILTPEFPLSGSLFNGAAIDLYLPLERNPEHDNYGYFMTVLGRLKPGATIDGARAELAVRQAALGAHRSELATIAQKLTPARVPVTRAVQSPLLLVLGGISCVVLMACANLANLLLVRASSRRREMHVRSALGATTRQMMRQTLTESAVLAIAGGAAGVVVASVLTRLLRSSSIALPRLAEVELSWPAVVVALVLCAMTTVAFGSLPLLHLSRTDLLTALRPHPGVSTERRTVRAQQLALTTQVAFALLLTAAGGLIFRSLVGLLSVDPGYEPRGVVAMRVDPAGRLGRGARMPFFHNVLERVSAVPGVESAAITINLPMDRNMGWDVVVPGEVIEAGLDVSYARIVSPGYFGTMGIPLISGRDFGPSDQPESSGVMAINQTLARRVAATGRAPLGATLTVNGRPRAVVAILRDVKHQSLAGESGREFYIPYTQAPGWQAFDLVVRAAEPLPLLPSIREAIWRVDKDQAVGAPVQLQELIDRTLRPQRLLGWLLGGFAATALILAALGVYGVVGYRVAQRTKEIAIRVALGATRGRVTSVVLREAFGFVSLGLVVGTPLALSVGHAMGGYLFGVAAEDWVTVMVSLGAVLAATLAAAYLPARRAPRIDPVAALRMD